MSNSAPTNDKAVSVSLVEAANRLLPSLKSMLLPVGTEQDGSHNVVLRAWWLQRREFVALPVTEARKIEGVFVPLVGLVDGWVAGRVVRAGRKEKFPRMSEVLLAAVQLLAKGVPSLSSYEPLRSGLHFVAGRQLIISGKRLFGRTPPGPWAVVDAPILADRYLLQPGGKDWLRLQLADLNRPLALGPVGVIKMLEMLLRKCWTFAHETDYELHSLLPFALTVQGVFQRKPLVHVQAESASGKTRLVEGYYAGTGYNDIGGPFVMNSALVTDPSVAGLTDKFSGAGLTLFLDEQELSERGHMTQVLALLRVAATGQSERVRGKATGGYREDRFSAPALLASIEDVGEKDQDANRWLVTPLKHEEAHDDPEQLSREFWRAMSGGAVSPVELQRTVFLGLLDKEHELYDAYKEVQQSSRQWRGALTTRYAENLLPVLAVAKVLGMDWLALAKRIAADKTEQFKATKGESEGTRLWELVVQALQQQMGDSLGMPSLVGYPEYPAFGLYVRDGLIWVNWGKARATFLRGTEFERPSAKALAKIAPSSSMFVENSRVHPTAGVRCTLFRLPNSSGSVPGGQVQVAPESPSSAANTSNTSNRSSECDVESETAAPSPYPMHTAPQLFDVQQPQADEQHDEGEA